MNELLTRDEFRESVFKRDGNKCVICSRTDCLDAHHIIERRLFDDGGYYMDNGSTLCPACHLRAESTELSCEEIREAVGIKRIVLPLTLYTCETYDKWGNPILPNKQRLRGELFYDESVQKVLSHGNMLSVFTRYVKYPKTNHLPWSEGVAHDDRIMKKDDVESNFGGKEVVVMEKLDGENSTMYHDYYHARSLDGRDHASRSWIKNLHATIRFDIPEDWRICGENMYAEHSIHYNELPSYFFVFGVYNEKNVCLSWDETVEWCTLIGLETVPVLYRGIYNEKKIREYFTGKSVFGDSKQEGYVMRVTSSIPFSNFKNSYAKMVRKNHVTTAHNWMNKAVVPNELKKL